jgi:D-sedoheptulose 7-phosphate isomerase
MEGLDKKYIFIEEHISLSIGIKKKILGDRILLDKIYEASNICLNAYRNNNKIILAGNGGSAADAQHIAAEFVSRFRFDRPGLPSLALSTDTSMITAIGNDYGYENIFSRQLQANGKDGDVLIAISTSGNSDNIIKAIEEAKSMGIFSIGLTNIDGGQLNDKCDLCINVPYHETAIVQESHIMIGHIICGYVEDVFFQDLKKN